MNTLIIALTTILSVMTFNQGEVYQAVGTGGLNKPTEALIYQSRGEARGSKPGATPVTGSRVPNKQDLPKSKPAGKPRSERKEEPQSASITLEGAGSITKPQHDRFLLEVDERAKDTGIELDLNKGMKQTIDWFNNSRFNLNKN